MKKMTNEEKLKSMIENKIKTLPIGAVNQVTDEEVQRIREAFIKAPSMTITKTIQYLQDTEVTKLAESTIRKIIMYQGRYANTSNNKTKNENEK